MKVTGNVKYITGVTQYVVDGNDGEINVDTSVYAVTIILPNIVNSGYENTEKGFVINDMGNAGTNNITIVAAGNTVNSSSSVVISVNSGTAKCSIANKTEWFVVTEPTTSSAASYLIYDAYLKQSGVTAPIECDMNAGTIVPNVANPPLQDTLLGVWSYVSAGQFNYTKAGAFANRAKVSVKLSDNRANQGSDILIYPYILNDNTIRVSVFLADAFLSPAGVSPQNGKMYAQGIEIKVYL